MTNRRKFLQQSGAFALGSLMLPHLSQAGKFFNSKTEMPVGLQLYTMGKLMTTDTKDTLQKLAAIGYKPKEFAAMVKDAGMHWRSAHVGGAGSKASDMTKDSFRPLNLTDNYQQLADDV